MAGSHTFALPLYARKTIISGNLAQLTTGIGPANDTATIARFSSGGTISQIQFVPELVNTGAGAPPSVGGSNNAKGWMQNVAQEASVGMRIDGPLNWRVVCRVKRSGQAGEVDTSCTLTGILYHVSSTGAFKEEMGRTTSTATVTTNGDGIAFGGSIFNIGPFTFAAGDRLEVEWYCQTLIAGVPTAPPTATDLSLITDLGWQDANYVMIGGPGQATITYEQTNAKTIVGVGKGNPVMTRQLSLHRTITGVGKGTPTIVKQMAKTIKAVGKGNASAFLRLAFGKVPSGGGSVVKRIIQIFDD